MQFIEQTFLQPLGLLGLLGLVPLIIFYLVKPKPKEEVMPSMAFFTEEKRESKVRNALSTLKRNKLFLLHVFFICFLALAIANPTVRGFESDGNSVILLDASASVSDNRQQIQDFALSHLGDTNTVIAASNDPEILVRDASTERARSAINNYEVKSEGTDLVSALELARNYDGRIVLASDMAHTSTNQELEPVLNEIASERNVKAININHENAHGFFDLEIEKGTAAVTVRNFLDENRTLEISSDRVSKEVDIGSLSSTTADFNLSPGTHELVLPPDELAEDNKMYVSIPEEDEINVARLGEESRYFEEAVKSIEFASYSEEFSEDADVYFIGENYDIDQKVEQEIDDSSSAVILESRGDETRFASVENYSGTTETEVQVSQDLATSFTSTIDSFDVIGEALAEPQEALVLSDNEKVLLYNVEDRKFGETLVYPVFWKNIIQRMTEVKGAEDLNMRAGQTREFDAPVNFRGNKLSGNVELDQVGFYRGQEAYAVNLLNPEESTPHINDIDSRKDIGQEPGKDPTQKYLSALLALVAVLEITFLSRRGEI
jgi:hypothetical protein